MTDHSLNYLDPVWRAAVPVEALTCDLLVELGYSPDVVSTENQVRTEFGHVLDVGTTDTVDLVVFELDDDGRKYLVWNEDARSHEPARHVTTVSIDPVRLARYRTDVAAVLA